MRNYFAEMLKASEADINECKNTVRGNMLRVGMGQISDEVDRAIRILWMHEFFHHGSGYDSFKPHLKSLLVDLDDRNGGACYEQYLRFIRERYCQNHYRYGDWFYKHCWMISGETAGQTSRMPRALLQFCEDFYEDRDNRGYEEEDYEDYPYFRNMYADIDARKNFLDMLARRDEYPALKDAIDRFQTKARAECGWYLEKNGDHLELILGVKRIRLALGDNSSSVTVTISAEHSKNETVTVTAARGHDCIRIAVDELIRFRGKGALTVKINECQVETVKKFDELLARFSDGSRTPICFKCPVNPGAYWFKLRSPDDEAPYNKPEIWIASRECPTWSRSWKLNVAGSDFYCYRQHLELTDEIQNFEVGGQTLFSYRNSANSVSFGGCLSDLGYDAQKWQIFSGNEAVLTARDECAWKDERNLLDEYRIEGNILRIVPGDRERVQAFEAFRTESGGVPRRKFQLLYIPERLVEKCRNGEAWSDGHGCVYEPEQVRHPEIMAHIQRGRYGDLTIESMTIKLFFEIPCDDAFFWLKEDCRDIEDTSEGECRLHDEYVFSSYGNMNDWSLCYVENEKLPGDGLPFSVVMHDGTRRELGKVPSFPQIGCRAIELKELTKRINPTVADGVDEIWFGDSRLFAVNSRPDSPQLFEDGGGWKVYMPEERRASYALILLSERVLGSFSDEDFAYVPCRDLRDEMAPIEIPERLNAHPHAVYAALIRDEKQVSLLSLARRFSKFDWRKIRESTESDCRNLFSDTHEALLQAVLEEYRIGGVFAQAQEFVCYPKDTSPESIRELWRQFAGRPESPWTIPSILKMMLENGYNFLAESGDDRREIKDGFHSTWLSTAFEEAMVNCNNTPTRQMTNFRTFSKLQQPRSHNGRISYDYRERNVVRKEEFLKIFIENRDADSKNFVRGEGWLPVALFQYLLENKRFGGKIGEIGTNSKLKLEECGLREITTINRFPEIWNFRLYDNMYAAYTHPKQGDFDPKVDDPGVFVWMPSQNEFLDGQARQFNTKLDYRNDAEEEDQLFDAKTFEASGKLLDDLLEILAEERPRPVARHLTICFKWILDNIRRLVDEGKQDLNHAVMGVTAIACRLAAQVGCREILTETERELLLGNVRTAFLRKFDNQKEQRDDEEFVPCGDCWRFLMYYIPPVDLVIWFYNSFRNRDKVYDEDEGGLK